MTITNPNSTLAPEFCGICGSRLVEDRIASVSGYDIYTGTPLSNESVSRRCPNPTVAQAGRFSKPTTTYHRTYRFDAGSWV